MYVALFKYLINVTPKKSFYVFNTINGKKRAHVIFITIL